jgi:hypothetical protein
MLHALGYRSYSLRYVLPVYSGCGHRLMRSAALTQAEPRLVRAMDRRSPNKRLEPTRLALSFYPYACGRAAQAQR